MDPPSTFKFPARESQPLLPLSPERVNGSTRPSSSRSNMTPKSCLRDDTENPSPRESPTRKANLFADYNPNARTDAERSAFPPPVGGLPTSPSLPEMHSFRSHVRTNSDVQGLVKRFEHLDVRDRDAEYGERRKKHELELRRAQVAREEAESDVKRLREEVRRLKKEGDEGRDRERKLGKRLEVVMEEYTRFKETQAAQTSVYEKEVRKAKKEAFKSSSAVLKVQEDLKSTRNTLRVTQSNLDMEKRKVQQREQETFDAQYRLVSVQEEVERLTAKLQVVEEEREALKTSLKEEEVARIAAEGMIALPSSSQDDDELLSSPTKRGSPQKRLGSPLSDDKENTGVVTKKMIETGRLREELSVERIRREHAEELNDFLKMECAFRCCRCRSDQRRHGSHSLTDAFDEAMANIRNTMQDVLGVRERTVDSAIHVAPAEQTDVEMDEAPTREEVDRSITITGDTPEEQLAREQAIVDDDDDLEETIMAPHPTPVDPEMVVDSPLQAENTTKIPILPSTPQTPAQGQPPTPFRQQHSVRTITTTTTIPMHFTPQKTMFNQPDDAENAAPATNPLSPSHNRSGSAPIFDREAALAAIAYRRGRAKSIANGHVTPRKQMIEGVSKERRDISAPALGQQKKAANANATKGTASVGRGVQGSAGRRLA